MSNNELLFIIKTINEKNMTNIFNNFFIKENKFVFFIFKTKNF